LAIIGLRSPIAPEKVWLRPWHFQPALGLLCFGQGWREHQCSDDRDLGHVVDREKAEIGLFVTLTEPTKPMNDEAVKAGYYNSPAGASFPKLQILTVRGLLDGTERARYRNLMQGRLTFKKAPVQKKDIE
jgi:hypothetical protein